MRDGRTRGRAQDRSGAVAPAMLSDRDQNTDLPYSSKQLRECYRQGAAAFGWDKRKAEPRSMRDGSDLVGWGMATGVWEALQMPAAVRIVLTANGHAEVATRGLGHRHRHLHDHGAGRGRHAWPADRQHQRQARRLDVAAKSGRGRIVDRSFGVQCDCDDGARGSQGVAGARKTYEEFAAGRRR